MALLAILLKTDLGGFVVEVIAAVLVGRGPVEGAGAGSEIPYPIEDPGPEGALGAA